MGKIIILSILVVSILFSIVFGLVGIVKLFIGYSKEELICSNCGKEITKKSDKCPHCKIKLKW